jgi:hypothetical protein
MKKKKPEVNPADYEGVSPEELRGLIERYQAPDGKNRWDPNGNTFEEGQFLLTKALKSVGLDLEAALFTSKDPRVQKLTAVLKTSNVPDGFEKWQLPFSLYGPSNIFITHGEPNAVVPSHWHKHGAGYRLILQGSLTLGNGTELGPGDWFYVPMGFPYSFRVGSQGLRMMSGYQC